jgi:hypothetical protein
MPQQHYRTHFKKALLQFITEPDPYLSMLKWMIAEMIRIEVEANVGAVKGKHSSNAYSDDSGHSVRAKAASVGAERRWA